VVDVVVVVVTDVVVVVVVDSARTYYCRPTLCCNVVTLAACRFTTVTQKIVANVHAKVK